MTTIHTQRQRPRFGDVVEITTADGAALAQYIHHHDEFGDMVRVVGVADGDTDAMRIAARPTQFVAFFPLGAACRRGVARIVGAAGIPASLTTFPTFRQALRLDPRSTEPNQWLLWNGADERVVPALTAEQRRWPIRAIMNDTLLVQRALAGWTAEKAP